MSVAYLDPGSGSLIASALVGGAAAAGVAVKSARARFTGAFSKKRKPEAGGDAADAEASTPDAQPADAPATARAAADEGEAVDAATGSDA